jgi:hypothetical protein
MLRIFPLVTCGNPQGSKPGLSSHIFGKFGKGHRQSSSWGTCFVKTSGELSPWYGCRAAFSTAAAWPAGIMQVLRGKLVPILFREIPDLRKQLFAPAGQSREQII